jgi:hypothetical protein
VAEFDWHGYLAIARFLQEQAGLAVPIEAAYRSVVSRAYYAAYGHGLRYATTYLGFVPRRAPADRTQDHGRLRAHLRSKRRAKTAFLLDRLRDHRNECDYLDDLGDRDLPKIAAGSMEDAESVFNSLLQP